jgi:hypothetical protein
MTLERIHNFVQDQLLSIYTLTHSQIPVRSCMDKLSIPTPQPSISFPEAKSAGSLRRLPYASPPIDREPMNLIYL